MKNLLFEALYFLGIAFLFSVGVSIVVFTLTFLRILYKKITGPECGHHYRQMTDKVGSPIKCLDCGKIVE